MKDRFYKKRSFRFSINLAGLIIAILGIILCLALVVSSVYTRNFVSDKLNNVDSQVEQRFQSALNALDNLESRIGSFTTPEQLDEAIQDIAVSNIERLESLNSTLEVINFGGRLDDPIKEVEELIADIEDFREKIPEFSLAKQSITEKIGRASSNINKVWSDYKDSTRTIRNYTNIGVWGVGLISMIFVSGEISLLRRSSSNLRRLKSA